ncbi:hypothetical protein XA68_17589 [Ophiocordyceps unilateralis]|uniref:Uncharacterized protein n=1 Tax=Ophiocordyceps unilateralis TaxID=268505 RepID=A0A2A9PKD6_OPHUN|nr:hypothetical protein XA68_17589 [Ophiocordyceps unilateralis]
MHDRPNKQGMPFSPSSKRRLQYSFPRPTRRFSSMPDTLYEVRLSTTYLCMYYHLNPPSNRLSNTSAFIV